MKTEAEQLKSLVLILEKHNPYKDKDDVPVYFTSHIIDAMKEAHNQAVRDCAESADKAKPTPLAVQNAILKNIIE